MSQAEVAKLEQLLGRIQHNRRAQPGRAPIGGQAAAPHEPAPVLAAPEQHAPPAAPAPEKKPVEAVPAPVAARAPAAQRIPTPAPAHELELELDLPVREPSRPRMQTPMEQALGDELPSSVEVEIRSASSVEIDLDDGPEISFDEGDADEGEDDLLEALPTAPVGTRAPQPVEARPVAMAEAARSGPVARIVSHPAPSEPDTFGELLGRSLALRPR